MSRPIELSRDDVCADCGTDLPAGSIARVYRTGVYGTTCHERDEAQIALAKDARKERRRAKRERNATGEYSPKAIAKKRASAKKTAPAKDAAATLGRMTKAELIERLMAPAKPAAKAPAKKRAKGRKRAPAKAAAKSHTNGGNGHEEPEYDDAGAETGLLARMVAEGPGATVTLTREDLAELLSGADLA